MSLSFLSVLRCGRPAGWLIFAAMIAAVQATPKVGVLASDGVSPFGQMLVSGLNESAGQAGIVLVVKSPPTPENMAQSQKLIAGFVNDRELVGLIITCGTGASELAKAAEPFRARDLPIIAILGRMPVDVAASCVLIDENAVIATAIERCSRLLKEGDEMALLRSNIRPDEVANDRERLVIEGLRQRFSHISIHADVYMNVEGSTPQAQAKLLLEKYPKTKLVYSPYSSATIAMISALRETGRAGTVSHVAIGAGMPKECAEAIEAGELNTWIALDPRDIATKAVSTMKSLLAGKEVPAVVFSPIKVVTKETMSSLQTASGK